MSWVVLILPVLYSFLPILFLGNNKVQTQGIQQPISLEIFDFHMFSKTYENTWYASQCTCPKYVCKTIRDGIFTWFFCGAEEQDYALVDIPGTTTCLLFSFCTAFLLFGCPGRCYSCWDTISYVLILHHECTQSSERRHKEI